MDLKDSSIIYKPAQELPQVLSYATNVTNVKALKRIRGVKMLKYHSTIFTIQVPLCTDTSTQHKGRASSNTSQQFLPEFWSNPSASSPAAEINLHDFPCKCCLGCASRPLWVCSQWASLHYSSLLLPPRSLGRLCSYFVEGLPGTLPCGVCRQRQRALSSWCRCHLVSPCSDEPSSLSRACSREEKTQW